MVLVSQSAEYALRAMISLAAHPRKILSTSLIAKQARTPTGYLCTKIIPALVRAGLLETIPGRAGGARLKRPPDAISLLDIVNAVDPSSRIMCCPLGLKSHKRHLCPLHRRLDRAAELVERAFAETTIAELANEHGGLQPFSESA